MTGLVVSSGDSGTARDQTAPLATSGANSGASSVPHILCELAQLSETMIMLADKWELGHARAIHEAIGKLLTPSNELPEVRYANVLPRMTAERSEKEA